ncbi:MAG: hypothetical protein U9N36_08425 [Euryarchaeota archaeon]|nr:hypothetical protein [Euryarchaeota archaeon]
MMKRALKEILIDTIDSVPDTTKKRWDIRKNSCSYSSFGDQSTSASSGAVNLVELS